MAFESFWDGVGFDLHAALVKAAPFKTGFLRNSLNVEKSDENEVTISMVNYGKFVEFGTPPHTIRPREKKALAWGRNLGGGKREFVRKSVEHPGTKPNPFIRTTIFTKLKKIMADNSRRHLT